MRASEAPRPQYNPTRYGLATRSAYDQPGGCYEFVRAAAAAALAIIGFAITGTAYAAPAANELRLYILDCGTIAPMDPTLFSLKKEEIKSDASFVSPCYLVVHPKGTLIWDVGQVPDATFKDDGTEAAVQGILKAKRKLAAAACGARLPAEGHHVPRDVALPRRSHGQRQPASRAPRGSCSRPSTT